MIYNQLKPGTYQFQLDRRGGIEMPKGERSAKSLEEVGDLADRVAVATETAVMIDEFKVLSEKMQALDDSAFDFNHTDKETMILKDAPLVTDATNSFGGPIVDGFVTAEIVDGLGTISLRKPYEEDPTIFELSQPGPQSSSVTRRAPGAPPITLTIDHPTQAVEVIVGSDMPPLDTGGYVVIR